MKLRRVSSCDEPRTGPGHSRVLVSGRGGPGLSPPDSGPGFGLGVGNRTQPLRGGAGLGAVGRGLHRCTAFPWSQEPGGPGGGDT